MSYLNVQYKYVNILLCKFVLPLKCVFFVLFVCFL